MTFVHILYFYDTQWYKFQTKLFPFSLIQNTKEQVGFSESSVCWTSNGNDKRIFTQQNHKNCVCFFELKWIKNLILLESSIALYKTARFKDDLYVINDGNEFSRSFKYIYPNELELKIKHQGTKLPVITLT